MVKELFRHGFHGFHGFIYSAEWSPQASGLAQKWSPQPPGLAQPLGLAPKWKAQPPGLAPKVQSPATLLWGLTPECRGSIKAR